MTKRWVVFIGVVLLIALGVAWVAIRGGVEGPALGGPGGAMSKGTYFNAEVRISHLPKLYEPFVVTATATARDDETDAELWIGSSGVYLDGEVEWHGPLRKGASKTISARFAVVAEGEGVVVALTTTSWGGVGYQYIPLTFYVTREKSQWELPPPTPSPVRRKGEPEIRRHAGSPFWFYQSHLNLNKSDQPRLEFIMGWEDIKRLQGEGLIPDPLRYQWRFLRGRDFTEEFLIAFWDRSRPTTGYLVQSGGESNYTIGMARWNYVSVPPHPSWQPKAEPTSPVAITLGRRHLGDPVVVQRLGIRPITTFHLSVEGQPFLTKEMPPVEGLPQGGAK